MVTLARSLTLRALLSRAASVAGLDRSTRITSGLTPAAKALAAVIVGRTEPGTMLLVVPTDKDVDQITADARFFFGALEGASETAVEQAVLPLPSLQVDPYRGMTPHFRVAAARARALHAAATGTARLLVASAASLLPRVSRPARLLKAAIDLRPGSEIEPLQLSELLVDAGFAREDPVEEHGSFTLRGGIVDVFPAGDPEPVRIEFVGDMVETLRRYDPASQRSTGPADHVHIVPARERFDDDDLVSVMEFLSTTPRLHVIVAELEQVEQHAAKIGQQLENSYQDATARGHVATLAPWVAFTPWEDLADPLAAAARLEELAIEEGDTIRHVSCQPAMEFRGRVGDWVADLRQARDRGDTVIFIADSAGRAERTAEILKDYEVVALPVDHADATVAAAVLIAVGTVSRGFRLTGANLQLYAE